MFCRFLGYLYGSIMHYASFYKQMEIEIELTIMKVK